jgi:hypothetical protein
MHVNFYEEPEYGRLIQYYFLKVGLQNGENGIYVTSEPNKSALIEEEMRNSGVM